VTIRNRDTMKQERIEITSLVEYFQNWYGYRKRFNRVIKTKS
jgi:glycyl-tRNA synthetase (class II)